MLGATLAGSCGVGQFEKSMNNKQQQLFGGHWAATACRSKSVQQRGTVVALSTHHSGHDWGSKSAWVRNGNHDPGKGGTVDGMREQMEWKDPAGWWEHIYSMLYKEHSLLGSETWTCVDCCFVSSTTSHITLPSLTPIHRTWKTNQDSSKCTSWKTSSKRF